MPVPAKIQEMRMESSWQACCLSRGCKELCLSFASNWYVAAYAARCNRSTLAHDIYTFIMPELSNNENKWGPGPQITNHKCFIAALVQGQTDERLVILGCIQNSRINHSDWMTPLHSKPSLYRARCCLTQPACRLQALGTGADSHCMLNTNAVLYLRNTTPLFWESIWNGSSKIYDPRVTTSQRMGNEAKFSPTL